MLGLGSVHKHKVAPLFHGTYFAIYNVIFSLTSTAALGQVRTATKRAGGTVRNNGSSPGKRLGIKKFSGALILAQYFLINR